MELSPVPYDALSTAPSTGADLPTSFDHALQLTFTMLRHALKNFSRHPHALPLSLLNPFITAVSSFLVTILKDKSDERVLLRAIPWETLAEFLSKEMPRRIIQLEFRAVATLCQKTHASEVSAGVARRFTRRVSGIGISAI